ncbi:MAG: MFS transporter [Tepidisphaeraceae bacterium]
MDQLQAAQQQPSPDKIAPRPSLARPALVLLLTINLFNYVDRQVLAAVVKPIQDDLHASKEAMGWAATAFLVSYMLFSPLFGWAADRFPRWALVAIGVGVWSLASGATGLAATFTALILTRCFVGIGEAAYGPVAPTLLSDLFPVEKRGLILSWFYAAIPVGSALGYVVGGAVAGLLNWRWAFWLVTPPGLLLAILALRMPEPPRGLADGAHTRQARWSDYLLLLRTPSYVLDTLGLTAMTFAVAGIAFWMPTYIVDLHTAGDLRQVNLIFGGIVVVSGLAATLTGGWLGDALRSRFPGSYFLVCATGMLLGFPLFFLMLYTPFPAAWGILFLVCFCLFLNTGPGNTILANVTHPSIRASAFALNILIIHALGDAISPPLIGAIADRWGLRAGFSLVSVVMLIAGILWMAGARHLQRDTAAAPTSIA